MNTLASPTVPRCGRFRSPGDRAREAQVAFFAFLIGEKRDERTFRALLESVFSTAELANKSGVTIRSHESFSKRCKDSFERLEHRLWRFVEAGASNIAVYEMMGEEVVARGFTLLHPQTAAMEAQSFAG